MSFIKKALDADKVKFLTFGQMSNSDLSQAEKEIVMDSYIKDNSALIFVRVFFVLIIEHIVIIARFKFNNSSCCLFEH